MLPLLLLLLKELLHLLLMNVQLLLRGLHLTATVGEESTARR